MDKFIHRENLALLEKRLAEAHDAAQHEILLKLQAEEIGQKSLPRFRPRGSNAALVGGTCQFPRRTSS